MRHLPEQSLFQIGQGSDIATMKYRTEKSTENNQYVIDFYSTFVPKSMRGKGVAEKLVRAGLTWAKEEGYTVTASCWYVEKFLHKKR
ncbi:GNAT family N-acetyltransferase [Marinomonas sp. 2405UD68-3]|uniref:GNAT family N-acetyltransferase n=1 Tax=Marinomonas sp. 2405UD68-3 TaxID=3391835 RepID=UPI0039C91F2D